MEEKTEIRICLHCGNEFVAVLGKKGRPRKYCSPECSKRMPRELREKKRSQVSCEICGKRIPLRNKRFCSKECANKAMEQPDRLPTVRRCSVCNKEFLSSADNHFSCLCASCKWAKWREDNPVKAATTRDHVVATRRAKIGARIERISRREVFKRDGWVCGICGKKVDRRLKHPDPMSVSLDHIIPLSKGGTHTLGNVQCSHLICNVCKGASGIGQLRLGLETTVPRGHKEV